MGQAAALAGGGTCLNAPAKFSKAFTLAEMMVVMLILSIVMAAFAPVMTTRSKSDRTSPWRYAANNSDIYFGLGGTQTAMIGQPSKVNGTDPSSRLIINTSDSTQKHITFKRGENNVVGSIHMSPQSILIGSSDSSIPTQAIAIGHKVTVTHSPGIAIGEGAESKNNVTTAIGFYSKASGAGATSLGSDTKAEGIQSSAVGYKASANGVNSTAMGKIATASGDNSIAIGNAATASGDNSTAIGEYASAEADQTIALHSRATGKSSTAIGYGTASNEFSLLLAPGKSTGGGENKSESIGYASTAIGSNSHAKGGYSVAIGTGSTTNSDSTLSIGPGTNTTGTGAIAIGDGASAHRLHGIAIGTDAKTGTGSSSAWGDYSIAIGKDAKAGGDANVSIGYNAGSASTTSANYNVAIGTNACKNMTSGSNKTCIGSNSGPLPGSSYSTDSIERVFIGSQSKYNGGTAVLEVHNTSKSAKFRNYGELPNNATSVVINGNLLLRGRLIMQPEVFHKNYVYDMCTMTITSGSAEDYAYYRYCGTESSSMIDILSDKRLKYVGKENTSGLEKIRQLKVFNYTFKKDKKKTPRVGVIAQDLQKVFPDAVTKNEDGFLTIRMEDMFYALVNAVKELDAKVTILIKQETAKDKKIKELEARLNKLEQNIK